MPPCYLYCQDNLCILGTGCILALLLLVLASALYELFRLVTVWVALAFHHNQGLLSCCVTCYVGPVSVHER